jgi:hypothetical protein
MDMTLLEQVASIELSMILPKPTVDSVQDSGGDGGWGTMRVGATRLHEQEPGSSPSFTSLLPSFKMSLNDERP